MKEKKQSIFKRIKNAWNELDRETKEWLAVVGIWTVDGALIGSIFTAAHMAKKNKAAVINAAATGYVCGASDAYRDIALEKRNSITEQAPSVITKQICNN